MLILCFFELPYTDLITANRLSYLCTCFVGKAHYFNFCPYRFLCFPLGNFHYALLTFIIPFTPLAIYPFKRVSKATMFTLGLCVGSFRVPLSLIYNTNKIWIVSYFLRLISNHIKKVYQLNTFINKQLSCQTLSLISDSHKNVSLIYLYLLINNCRAKVVSPTRLGLVTPTLKV